MTQYTNFQYVKKKILCSNPKLKFFTKFNLDMVLECSQSIPQLTKLMCWCRQVYKVGWICNLHMWYLFLFCTPSAVAIERVAGGHGADSPGDLPVGPRPPEAAGWGDRAPPPRAWHCACCSLGPGSLLRILAAPYKRTSNTQSQYLSEIKGKSYYRSI